MQIYSVNEFQLLLNIKAAESICEEHEAQLSNYLKATDLEVRLLLKLE
ncbi:MAG: GxxExxY protein [Ignavibacteriaceae bacterium]|nr:GxxExxY protein [Ignavibacteriaceae bacterium]